MGKRGGARTSSGPDNHAASGRAARLFVEADLNAGGEVRLADERVHYLRHVLRLGPGAPVPLFNGRDGEWRGALLAVAKAQVTLAVERQLRPQIPGPDLWLAFAPIKRIRIDIVAEKATELGVAALLPVVTRRTAVERANMGRLQAIARE